MKLIRTIFLLFFVLTSVSDASYVTKPSAGGGGGNLGLTCTNGQVPQWNGSGFTQCLTASGTGTVTSASLTTPSWLTVTGSPITASGTFAVTGTPQSANNFLASPNGSSGVMTPRPIVAADIPTLNQNTTGTAANVTGTVAIANGGTGQATATAAINALLPSQSGVTSGWVLSTDGTNTAWAAGGGGSSNSFKTIAPTNGTSPVASSSTDTLNLASSDSSVTVTGNSGTKTIDFKTLIPEYSKDSGTVLYFGVAPAGAMGTSNNSFIAGSSSTMAAATTAAAAIIIGDNNTTQQTTASDIISIGSGASQYGSSGRSGTVCIGSAACGYNASDHSVFMGYAAGYGVGVAGTGDFNTCVGSGCLEFMNGTSSHNTALGGKAGITYTSYTSATLVGGQSDAYGSGSIGCGAFGYQAICPRDNFIQIGGSANVGVGITGYAELKQLAADPGAPPSGYQRLYFKTDNHLYMEDSSATVTQVK